MQVTVKKAESSSCKGAQHNTAIHMYPTCATDALTATTALITRLTAPTLSRRAFSSTPSDATWKKKEESRRYPSRPRTSSVLLWRCGGGWWRRGR